MPRDRYRACLEDGLKLDINSLAARGFVKFGASTGPIGIQWRSSYSGDTEIGWIWADMTGQWEGWFRLKLREYDRRIILVPKRRHFGGQQWYFVCPYMNRLASVLWRPPGAQEFSCRQRWGRRVAYRSQFCTPIDRAHRGKAKINAQLCSKGGFNADEWDLPPKPKWMRWRTYDRAVAKYDRYEGVLDEGLEELAKRLGLL